MPRFFSIDTVQFPMGDLLHIKYCRKRNVRIGKMFSENTDKGYFHLNLLMKGYLRYHNPKSGHGR